jgi:hypothetical protein
LACAPGAAREGGAGPGIRVVPSAGGAEIFQQSDARPTETVVFAPTDTAWRALAAVYQELGISVTTVNRANHLLGNANLSVQGRLGGQWLANYFNCGTGIAGEVANSARLQLNVFSQLTDHPDGSLLRTLVQATATNPRGASADPVLCRSTGRLEGLIGGTVRLRALGRS